MDVVVVGSGPNGLAAAVILARAGLEVCVYESAPAIGGGARTAEFTRPGFRHDTCSSVHPMGIASPFFRAFDLAAHGVEMLQPEVPYAHPLDGGRAGIAWRDLTRTADGLGRDGRAWRRLLGPLVRRYEDMVGVAMSDLRSIPPGPLTAARFGLRVLEQGTPLWGARFTGDTAPAMLTGIAAHAMMPPCALAPAGAALMLATLAHAVGWPVPRGGSQAISDALATDLLAHGGVIHTGHRVGSLAGLPPARAMLFDVSPAELVRIAGDALPRGYVRAVRRFRDGPGACKVDFALAGPVPWAAAGCELAGTVHVVGSRADAVAAERAVAAGRHPARPYVLAIQPGVVDPERAPAGAHTLSGYTHVPNGSRVDMTDPLIAQLDRFAPGIRDLILDCHVTTAAGQQAHNANLAGGDIMGGAMTTWQTLLRPVPRWDPYRTPLDGGYLCSASTPPGPGVHGMGGLNATRRVLRQRFGIRTSPLELLRRTGEVPAPAEQRD